MIPVVVAIISTFRWPTLERRVQRHVTLIKELPDGTGAPMRQLLEDELSALARRDRERLEAHEGLILFGFRLMLFVPLAASLIAAWRSGDLADDSPGSIGGPS